MHKFGKTTEDLKNPEAHEILKIHETSHAAEKSAAEISDQMPKEAARQVADFENSINRDFEQFKERVDKEKEKGIEIQVSPELKEELQGLDVEADSAREELNMIFSDDATIQKKAFHGENESGEKKYLQIISSGQKKIHALFFAGKQESLEYKRLAGALMREENGQIFWKSREKIDVAEVESVLEIMDRQEIFDKAKEKIQSLHAEGKGTSYQYLELYTQLVDLSDAGAKWKNVNEIDTKKLKMIIDSIDSPELPEMQQKLTANEKQLEEVEEIELEESSVEYYIQKSKIKNKHEALSRLMSYAGATSIENLREKMKQQDENGDNLISIISPEVLDRETRPSLNRLRKIQASGNALGYTFGNTPGYRFNIGEIIGNLEAKGKYEDADEVKNIFQLEIAEYENEKNKSVFQKIDDRLLEIAKNKEEYQKYIEQQKNLPGEAIVYLYHGLNKSGFDGALKVLDSPSHGIEQHSGPTVSLMPVGQFWNGVGFRYAIKRDQIEFSGENNPNAVIKMTKNSFGEEGDGIIVNETGNLPLDQFEAEILRSKNAEPNPQAEKELVERLHNFSAIRKSNQKEVEKRN